MNEICPIIPNKDEIGRLLKSMIIIFKTQRTLFFSEKRINKANSI